MEKKNNISKKIEETNKKIQELVDGFSKLRDNRPCYPLLSPESPIGTDTVDTVFEELQNNDSFKSGDKLDVILESSGGDIDSAYNLSNLFRKFAKSELIFFIPRWAKSAATLLACSGDKIFMTPVAELGPIDPQITQISSLERRTEVFSPLHIESTLDLIRKEYNEGNQNLADKLMERLQFPLTLGRFKKSLEIGTKYVQELLETRMLKEDKEKAESIAKKLTEGYPDHSYCLGINELKSLGLKAEELTEGLLKPVWGMNCLLKQRHTLIRKKKEKEIIEKLKGIPDELLQKIPPDLAEKLNVPTKTTANIDRETNMNSDLVLSTKLAVLLLLRYGKITVTDIECLPFVEDRKTADAIATRLSEILNIERHQKKMGDSLISGWESVLSLKSTTKE